MSTSPASTNTFERLTQLPDDALDAWLDAFYGLQHNAMLLTGEWLHALDEVAGEQREILATLAAQLQTHSAQGHVPASESLLTPGPEAAVSAETLPPELVVETVHSEHESMNGLAAPLSVEELGAAKSTPLVPVALEAGPRPEPTEPVAPPVRLERGDLIAAVMQAAPSAEEQAALAVDAVLDGIVAALVRGEEVRLPGFGTFRVDLASARTGHSPRTGEPIAIPAHRRPVFRPGSKLRAAVR